MQDVIPLVPQKNFRTATINQHGCGCAQMPLEERIQCSKEYVQPTLAPLAIEIPQIICSIYVLSGNSVSCQVKD